MDCHQHSMSDAHISPSCMIIAYTADVVLDTQKHTVKLHCT